MVFFLWNFYSDIGFSENFISFSLKNSVELSVAVKDSAGGGLLDA